ncbi:hypothetical protein FKM82_023896 [Ascaphus truei]
MFKLYTLQLAGSFVLQDSEGGLWLTECGAIQSTPRSLDQSHTCWQRCDSPLHRIAELSVPNPVMNYRASWLVVTFPRLRGTEQIKITNKCANKNILIKSVYMR